MEDNDSGGLPGDVQDTVRDASLEALLEWDSGKPIALPCPEPALLARMLGVSMGETIDPDYGEMFAGELDLEPHRMGVTPRAAVPANVKVMVVGAGVSGLCVAMELKSLGIDFTVVEKHPSLGGTWHENTYPGAGVDVPSHLYTYASFPHDWAHHFPYQREVREYLERVAAETGVRAAIRFSTEVVTAAYDDSRRVWTVTLRERDGSLSQENVNFLISAVGAFNPPRIPDIAGLKDFEGPQVHTARWPADLDLAGKRVAVIGTGASAMQVVPAIATEVASLTIFQRSPQWVQPNPKLHQPIPSSVRYLIREVPLYAAWHRLRWAWIFHDKLHPALQKDPAWQYPDRSVNAINDRHREYFTSYIESELGGNQDLIAKVLPSYPPFGKRMLMDQGWFKTLTRENVNLVTDSVREVGPTWIQTESGDRYEVDVIVLATGFDVVRFISTFELVGRNGRSLRDAWDDDNGRAFLGLAIPEFPNFFCIFGPNTQSGHGGSLIFTVEAQVHYVLSALQQTFELGLSSLEIRQDVFGEYARRVDAANEAMIWTHPGMDTYYRNSRGRVVVNSPFRNLDFWRMTRHADLADFTLTVATADSADSVLEATPAKPLRATS